MSDEITFADMNIAVGNNKIWLTIAKDDILIKLPLSDLLKFKMSLIAMIIKQRLIAINKKYCFVIASFLVLISVLETSFSC